MENMPFLHLFAEFHFPAYVFSLSYSPITISPGTYLDWSVIISIPGILSSDVYVSWIHTR